MIRKFKIKWKAEDDDPFKQYEDENKETINFGSSHVYQSQLGH
jgi:hypothetical protein